MKRQDINTMTVDELHIQRKNLIEEYFNLRIQSAIRPLPNPKRIRQIKKDIARINTILHEYELGIRKPAGENAKK